MEVQKWPTSKIVGRFRDWVNLAGNEGTLPTTVYIELIIIAPKQEIKQIVCFKMFVIWNYPYSCDFFGHF